MMNLRGRLRSWLGKESASSNGVIPLHSRHHDDRLVELPELESDDLTEEPTTSTDLRAWSEAFNKMTAGRDLDSPLDEEIATEPNARTRS